MIAATALQYGYPAFITIDLGVMALSMLRVVGWGEHVHQVPACWDMAERIKPLGKPLDVCRRELNVEPIRHGQNSWYKVLATLELQECLYDFVANRAHWKGGHCPLHPDTLIYAIDNGLSFESAMKFGTVIWDHAGEPIPSDVLEDLTHFVKAPLAAPLSALLHPDERQALRVYTKALANHARFPEDPSRRHHPWSQV